MEKQKTESGTQVHGEPQKALLKEEKKKPSTSVMQNQESKREEQNLHQSNLKKKDNGVKQATIGTGKYSTFNDQNEESVTPPTLLNSNENDMKETRKRNEGKSMTTDSSEIQPSGSNQLSTVLREERLNSMKLLDDTTKQLKNLSDSLLRSMSDEEGEFRKPSHSEIDLGVQVLSEIRSNLRLKLDYLKFGKELAEMREKQ